MIVDEVLASWSFFSKGKEGRFLPLWLAQPSPTQSGSSDGIGEWILVDFGGLKRLSHLRIWNGFQYQKNPDIFLQNNRVRDAEIILSNGHRQTATLSDIDGPQNISLTSSGYAQWVQFKILSVYRGTKYRDTAISELNLEFND
jgi:hypothetical protein